MLQSLVFKYHVLQIHCATELRPMGLWAWGKQLLLFFILDMQESSRVVPSRGCLSFSTFFFSIQNSKKPHFQGSSHHIPTLHTCKEAPEKWMHSMPSWSLRKVRGPLQHTAVFHPWEWERAYRNYRPQSTVFSDDETECGSGDKRLIAFVNLIFSHSVHTEHTR